MTQEINIESIRRNIRIVVLVGHRYKIILVNRTVAEAIQVSHQK